MAERPVVSVIAEPDVSIIVNAFFTSAERAQTLEKPLREVAARYSNEIAANFAAEGRPTGWKGLADSTIVSRKSHGYGEGPILVRSGVLKDEATNPESWQISGGGQLVVANLEVEDYGTFHLTGTTHMPTRDWAYMSPEAEANIDDLFLDWVAAPLEALP